MKKTLFQILFYILGIFLGLFSGCFGSHDDSLPPEETLTAMHSFERIADADRREGAPPATADGPYVIIRHQFSHGTPYAHEEILFDPAMFSVTQTTETSLSDDISYKWCFTPLAPGETEIMQVRQYLTDDTLVCLVLHITIADDLSCCIDWYEEGVAGEHYRIEP